MRIRHVTDCYLPGVGGIELHVRDLVAAQRALGHDAVVVTRAPAGPDVVDPPWVRRVTDRWASALGDALASADVVHVHVSVWSPFATLAARTAARLGVPAAVTVHSMWSHLHGLPSVAALVLDLASWPIAWSAVSDRAAGPVRRALGPGAVVRVLPNAVDPARWPATTRPAGGVPTVVSVMRLTSTKRPLPLARALRRVRAAVPADQPMRAVIVGEGGRGAALESYLARHRMDWVELPGRLSRDRIRAELARATMYVAPAERESFGIAALEARCSGLPVVASRRSGVVEFVEDGVSGLLFDDDRGMADAMTRLILEPGLSRAIAANNQRAPTGVDWEAATAGSLSLYDVAAARLAEAVRPRVRPAPAGALR